jgi:hypothetical protein
MVATGGPQAYKKNRRWTLAQNITFLGAHHSASFKSKVIFRATAEWILGHLGVGAQADLL